MSHSKTQKHMKLISTCFCPALLLVIAASIAEASMQKAPFLWGDLKPGLLPGRLQRLTTDLLATDLLATRH